MFVTPLHIERKGSSKSVLVVTTQARATRRRGDRRLCACA